MNVLLIVLAIIGGLIALIFIIALFSKKGYTIERSVTILKPVSEVFNYIKYIRNQDHYNKWVMRDPQMKKDFRGQDGTVGFIYAWDGNKQAGAGEQEITGIEEGKRVNMEVRFVRPFKGVANGVMETAPTSGESTLVRWTFSSEMKYPANIFLVLTNIEKALGRDLETSLGMLKGILEK